MDELTGGVRKQSSDLIEYVRSGHPFPVGRRMFRVASVRSGSAGAVSTPEVFVQIRMLCGCGGAFVRVETPAQPRGVAVCAQCRNLRGRAGVRYTMGLYGDQPVGDGFAPLLVSFWLERVR